MLRLFQTMAQYGFTINELACLFFVNLMNPILFSLAIY